MKYYLSNTVYNSCCQEFLTAIQHLENIKQKHPASRMPPNKIVACYAKEPFDSLLNQLCRAYGALIFAIKPLEASSMAVTSANEWELYIEDIENIIKNIDEPRVKHAIHNETFVTALDIAQSTINTVQCSLLRAKWHSSVDFI